MRHRLLHYGCGRLRASLPAGLLLLALHCLSCDGGLKLVVVEAGGSSALSTSGGDATGATGATAGSVGIVPMGGTSSDAGTTSNGGSSGDAGTSGDSGGNMIGSADMPDVPIWDAPPRYTASFVSHTYPDQFMRHVDDKGVIAAIDMTSSDDREAASFEMIPGLYDSVHEACVSFRELNKPATFFRHSGSRIYMNPASDVPLFFADATFCTEAGMADAEGVTFRSVNYPQRVIHLRNMNELWIDDVPVPLTPDFASEATFYRQTALSEQPSL